MADMEGPHKAKLFQACFCSCCALDPFHPHTGPPLSASVGPRLELARRFVWRCADLHRHSVKGLVNDRVSRPESGWL